MNNRLKPLLIKAVLGFGLAFAVFALSSELRLGLLVPWIVLAVLLSRLDWERYGRFLRLEWVVFLAVVFRAVFFCVNYSGDMDVFQCGDGTQFWRWAQEAAVGGWPEVKSWTTVAAYAVIVKLVGCHLSVAIAFNFALQLMTGWLLFVFGKRVFGWYQGFFACAVYLLSPTFVLLTFTTLSEHFFYLFMALGLCALERWRVGNSWKWAASVAVFAWLATWSRGEGILLLAVAGSYMVCTLLEKVGDRRTMVLSVVALVAVASLMGLAGFTFNKCAFGVNTAFCSDDSWWPRLHGANLETQGRLASKMPIYEQYLVEHPGDPAGVRAKKKPNYCPPELVPYIKKEVARRWGEMSLWTKIKFVVRKEHYDWANAYAGRGRRKAQGIRGVVYEVVPVGVLLYAAWGLICMFRKSQQVEWIAIAPLLVLIGMACVLVLYESNIRYGTMLLVLMPFYAGRRCDGIQD